MNLIKCSVKRGLLITDRISKKKYRSYDICISINDNSNIKQIQFSIRFSTLIDSEIVLPSILKGYVPSRHIFSNYITNDMNINKRIKEIQEYLNKIFNNDIVLSLKRYHELLGINKEDSNILCEFKNKKQNIDKEYKKNKKDIIHNQYTTAQTFITQENISSNIIPILTFDDNIIFNITSNNVNDNTHITGPDNKIWFKFNKTGTILDFSDKCTLTTMAGKPLMEFNQDTCILEKHIELIRIGPSNSESWCTITLDRILASISYKIEKNTKLCPTINVTDYSNGNGTISEEGKGIVLTIETPPGLNKGYSIKIKRNEDIILYLSIAIALQNINHYNSKSKSIIKTSLELI